MSAGSDYQRLRAHLAFLKMTAAAEALPGLLASIHRVTPAGCMPMTGRLRRSRARC